MNNYGYIAVDFGGFSVGTESQTITGIYERMSDALQTGKFIVTTNIEMNSYAASPTPVGAFITSNGLIFVNFGSYTFVIRNDDSIGPAD